MSGNPTPPTAAERRSEEDGAADDAVLMGHTDEPPLKPTTAVVVGDSAGPAAAAASPDDLPDTITGKKLPIDFVEDSLRDRVRDAKLISEIIVFIPFLILFILFSLLVLDIEKGHFAVKSLKTLSVYANFPKNNVVNRTVWTQYTTGGVAAVVLDPDNYWDQIGVVGNWNDWLTATFQNLWRCPDSQLPFLSATEAQIVDANDILARYCATPAPAPAPTNSSTNSSTSNSTTVSNNYTAPVWCLLGVGSAPPDYNPLIGNTSDITSRYGWPLYLKGQAVPLGSLRLRMQRVSNTSCSVPSHVSSGESRIFDEASNVTVDVDQTCYEGKLNSGSELKTSPLCYKTNPLDPFGPPLFQYKSCGWADGYPITTELGAYHCGGYTVDVPFNVSCVDALRVLYQITDSSCPFVDPTATRFAALEYFVYFANLGFYVSVKHVLEITSGGAFLVSDQYRAFTLLDQDKWGLILLDFIFLAYVVYYIVMFFVEWRRFAKAEGRILRYLLNIWAIVELANVCTYIAVFILRWIWWSASLNYNQQLPYTKGYPDDLDTILFIFSSMRYAIAVNFVLTFLKVLKFLKISDRLAVISNTFEKAQADVLGLLVIFVFIVLGFAVSGTALFGTQIWGFASLDRSIGTLLFMLLGQLDYEGMKNVNPTLAGLYFWSFLILGFFLVLNFIVAVIGDSFGESCSETYIDPLADALVITGEGIIWNLRPTIIGVKLKLLRQGKSADGLEAQMLGYVAQGHARLRLTAGGSTVMVSPDEVMRWFPTTLRRDGCVFFYRFWEVAVNTHARVMLTDEAQAEEERRTAIISGTRQGLGPLTMERSRETLERLDAVNRVSNDLIAKLQERSAWGAKELRSST